MAEESKKEESKKRAYVNEEQKNVLIEFMRTHPELLSGKFSSSFTYKHAQKLWEGIAKQLNAIPGAVKEWKQWRKTWQDMRSSTKTKNTILKNHAGQTGVGPPSKEKLSQIDQNVLGLMSLTAVEGHATVEESGVNFEWDHDFDTMEMEYLENEISHEDLLHNTNKENEDLYSNNYGKEETKIPNKEVFNSYNEKRIETSGIPATSNNLIAPITNATSKRKGRAKTSMAARRFQQSISQTEKLGTIFQDDCETHKKYYEEKIQLYKLKVELEKRNVETNEKIANLLEYIIKKNY